MPVLPSLPYFFAHTTRLFDPRYVPSTQDILHAYEKTKGLVEDVFEGPGPAMDIQMILVGDGVGERRKWIHCFEDVDAVVFVASLNSYDRSSSEDRSVVRVVPALLLFCRLSLLLTGCVFLIRIRWKRRWCCGEVYVSHNGSSVLLWSVIVMESRYTLTRSPVFTMGRSYS